MNTPAQHNHASALSARLYQTADTIVSLGLLNDRALALLSDQGIKSLDDLADLASDELRDIIGPANMSQDRADQVIMAARAHWFATAN
jgi:N utilization substance protein A